MPGTGKPIGFEEIEASILRGESDSEDVCWVSGSNGWIPDGGVVAGHDKDAGQLYAGRAYHEGDFLPAKVCPQHGTAYVSYGGKEVSVRDYEVLCHASVAWVQASGGFVPADAVAVGQTCEGECLYMGRVFHDGNLTPGKVHPSHGVCYIPYGGEEIGYPDYEVLTSYKS